MKCVLSKINNRKKSSNIFIYYRNISIFALSNNRNYKDEVELHRLILENGWMVLRQRGSHVIYIKEGRTYPVPNHGSKEIGKGLEKKIKKEMGLE